jgi:site-specific DNA recombinase
VAGGLHVVLRDGDFDNTAKPLRAVVGSRVSHLDDAKDNTRKVSYRAQTEEGSGWALAHGYAVVGAFEDLGISAGKTRS